MAEFRREVKILTQNETKAIERKGFRGYSRGFQ